MAIEWQSAHWVKAVTLVALMVAKQGNDASFSGAVYMFERVGASWSQQAYIKASNAEEDDSFGRSISLSNDGDTLAVSSVVEGSNSIGINGDESNNSAQFAGAVYVYGYNNNAWAKEAYIKASNAETRDQFGTFASLSGDGNLLLVGAVQEKSNSVGLNGDQSNNTQSQGAGRGLSLREVGRSMVSNQLSSKMPSMIPGTTLQTKEPSATTDKPLQ